MAECKEEVENILDTSIIHLTYQKSEELLTITFDEQNDKLITMQYVNKQHINPKYQQICRNK